MLNVRFWSSASEAVSVIVVAPLSSFTVTGCESETGGWFACLTRTRNLLEPQFTGNCPAKKSAPPEVEAQKYSSFCSDGTSRKFSFLLRGACTQSATLETFRIAPLLAR